MTLPSPILEVPPRAAPAGRGFLRETWRRFRRDRFALAGFVFVAALAVLALAAPLIAGTKPIVCRFRGEIHFPFLAYYRSEWEPRIFIREGIHLAYPVNLARKDPESWAVFPPIYQDPEVRVTAGEREGDPGNRTRQAPSARHLFGTDDHGRDVFTRVLYGTRSALLVGLVAMAIAAVVGLGAGAIAGWFGGWIDAAISRLIDLLMSIPTLILLLALLSVVERPTVGHLVLLIGLTRWETIARYTRAEFLRLRESDFVLAARALGSRWPRIVFRHILPNALAPAIVTITFGIANTVLLESALSYLGFGVPPPAPSWGSILKAWHGDTGLWWLAVFPGLAIFLTVLAYNVIGDALEEALDPRRRR